MKTKIRGISMVYEDLGSGPAIVVMHGRPLDSRKELRPIKALVQAGFRLVILQAPQKNEECSRRVDANTAALVGFLDYLGIGRAVFFADAINQDTLEALQTQYPGRIAGYDHTQSGYSCEFLEHRLHHFLSIVRSKASAAGLNNRPLDFSKFFSLASGI